MLTTLRPAVLACLAPALLAGPSQSAQQAPPSTVLVPAGDTYIGSDPDDIEALLERNSAARNMLRSLDAETPQKRMDVGPFFMMVTECTNEQYAAFVQATGHRPPFEWADPEDLDAGRLAFLEAEQAKKRELAAQGQRYDTRKFYADEWWDENWRDNSWSVPAGRERHPVERVDYSDALAYCTWAGLRLPTEFEFQRAGRGDQKQLFPWGDEWEVQKYAVTAEARVAGRERVASKPDGASVYGIHDLAGNVWEWTQSPYLPYPGYKKPNSYKIEREKVDAIPANWNGNQRVVVGGCYQTEGWVARLTTRRPTERFQLTNALGFRAAGTPRVAYDVAVAVDTATIKPSDIRAGVVFDPEISVGIDRWTSAPSQMPDAPEGYSVITGYDYFTFVPAAELPSKGNMRDLDQLSLEQPVHLGFFATTEPLLEPALQPGVYILSYRAKGKLREEQGDEEGGAQGALGGLDLESIVDIDKDNLLIFDAASGELVHHAPVTGLDMVKPKGPSTLALATRKAWEGTGEDKVQVEHHWLEVQAVVPTELASRALAFPFEVRIPAESAGKDWRRE